MIKLRIPVQNVVWWLLSIRIGFIIYAVWPTCPWMAAPAISLWGSDAMWRRRSSSSLVQVMACCLTAPSHYMKQCYLQCSFVAFTERQFYMKCSWHQLIKWVRKLHFSYYSNIGDNENNPDYRTSVSQPHSIDIHRRFFADNIINKSGGIKSTNFSRSQNVRMFIFQNWCLD